MFWTVDFHWTLREKTKNNESDLLLDTNFESEVSIDDMTMRQTMTQVFF